jgi:hypothetical protein
MAIQPPMPTPILRKLSDATVVAKQIGLDAPVQATFASHSAALKQFFTNHANKRVHGVLMMSENSWLRLTKAVKMNPDLVSSKSLRHFAACSQNASGSTESGLDFNQFCTALGLCAIYIFREHAEEWSLREKAIALFASLKDFEPAFKDVKLPVQFIGPQIEHFLWRLFHHFSSTSTTSNTDVKKLALTNWGWSKLVRELGILDGVVSSSVHPDVMYNKYATKGKLSFDAFVSAIAEFDRLIKSAHSKSNLASTGGSTINSPRNRHSPQPHVAHVDQENHIPLSHLFGEITSTGVLAHVSTAPSSQRRR